jgi:hypothetical protein
MCRIYGKRLELSAAPPDGAICLCSACSVAIVDHALGARFTVGVIFAKLRMIWRQVVVAMLKHHGIFARPDADRDVGAAEGEADACV